MAVELVLCPSMFQDLAEPDPLETVVAFVSNVVTRAAKAANHLFNIRNFRIFEPLFGKASGRNFSNLDTFCRSSGNFAICTNISLIFSSIVLARYPVPSRSGREPLGEPYSKRRQVREIRAHPFHLSYVP